MAEQPAWKKRPQTAGAMIMVKGYVETVTICDVCEQPLADAEGYTQAIFRNGHAHYPCASCGSLNARAFQRGDPSAESV